VQVLLASVLVIGTAVQVRTFVRFMAPRGVDTERVTLIGVDLGRRDDVVPRVRRLVDQLGTIQGVEAAAAVGEAGLGSVICDESRTRGPEVVVNLTAPGFLRSIRIPLERGRDFRWDDEQAAIVNRTLARRLFGDADPIGRTLRLWDCQERLTVIGVAADSNNAVGPGFEGGNGTEPTLYVPLSSGVFGNPIGAATLFVRSRTAPLAADTLIRIVREVDAAAEVGMVQTQAQLLAANRRGLQTASSLLVAVTLLAVFQAAFGLYAVLAHFVTDRTAEIGIRAVLGATPTDLVRLVVRQSLTPVGIGLGVAVGLTPVAVSVLTRARLTAPLDAWDQVAVLVPVLALLLAAFAAACGPALRATRIAPSLAVRGE
jgi:ABC-type antimicrobial peptide transport system permease subunit